MRRARLQLHTHRQNLYYRSVGRYYEEGRDTDETDDASFMAIHSNFLPDLVPELVPVGKEAPGPRQMPFDELQRMLGLLETDEQGAAILEPKYLAATDVDFKAKRQAAYAGEALIAAASVGLPDGWVARLSTSSGQHEVYFIHVASL